LNFVYQLEPLLNSQERSFFGVQLRWQWPTLFPRIVSSLPFTPQHQAAWLMLPGDEEEDATHSRCILNLAEKKLYKIENVFQPFLDAWCVGSSHGWLILLDEKANPHLFNPFSNARI
jgi:hypothetical protein